MNSLQKLIMLATVHHIYVWCRVLMALFYQADIMRAHEYVSACTACALTWPVPGFLNCQCLPSSGSASLSPSGSASLPESPKESCICVTQCAHVTGTRSPSCWQASFVFHAFSGAHPCWARRIATREQETVTQFQTLTVHTWAPCMSSRRPTGNFLCLLSIGECAR